MWSRLHSMETVQIVLEESLLHAADRAARRLKMNRSALVRAALREHLRRLEVRERERADREGYRRRPAEENELAAWDEVATWPDD
jgi:metal-responsive CopG/Arc/MetJ family transcriptional regulator